MSWRTEIDRLTFDVLGMALATSSQGEARSGDDADDQMGVVKANECSRFSALNSAERGGNSRAKTVELQPALVREQAV
jgi:hypothetical protein